MSDDRLRFKRFYLGKEWRKLRLLKLSNDPLCECCLSGCSCYYPNMGHVAIYTPAYAIDHVQPLALRYDLRLDYDNLASLCAKCHQIKTNTKDHYLKRDWSIQQNMHSLNAF